MRVALYARVSTSDRDQDPDTQVYRLRDHVAARDGWTMAGEYVDRASASDLGHRTGWRRLLDDAGRRRFNAVLVFTHDTLAAWEVAEVGFLSAQEGFDTSTALGRLLLNLLASLAEFEVELIRERVVAGMERARRQGKRIGRPTVWQRGAYSTATSRGTPAEGDQPFRLNATRRSAARRPGVPRT